MTPRRQIERTRLPLTTHLKPILPSKHCAKSGLAGNDPLADIRVCSTLARMTKEYILDGAAITSLETFFDQISSSLFLGDWGRNLDALEDILCGGEFGVPKGGFTLRWIHSDVSRANLGYTETTRQLEKRLSRCHPSNRDMIRAELETARQGKGSTVFDWLIDIINDHKENVRLVLA